MKHPKEERTLVLIKPDAVARGLVGEIITRFEMRGFKILAMKFVYPTHEHAAGHYSGSEEWLLGMGTRNLASMAEHGMDPMKEFGTSDPLAMGKIIQEWNVSYLSSGPVVAIVLQGMHAISTVRKLIGHTLPVLAEPGTIRGDYSIDAATASSLDKRTVRNVVHASGNEEEAEAEIKHWFTSGEIVSYKRADEDTMFS